MSQYFPHRRFGFIEISNKTETILSWKKFRRAGLFGDDRSPESEKCRRTVADPARSPRHINAFDRGEFAECAGEVAAVRARGARDPVRIDNFPAQPLQPFSLRVFGSYVHRQFELRLRDSAWKMQVGPERQFLR